MIQYFMKILRKSQKLKTEKNSDVLQLFSPFSSLIKHLMAPEIYGDHFREALLLGWKPLD